ncbi:MAG: glycosyltransferase family 39 protein [Anaerolineales bacterium]|nr:glycosyltransferase family 39 protein [Anaerolineales bacterium]
MNIKLPSSTSRSAKRPPAPTGKSGMRGSLPFEWQWTILLLCLALLLGAYVRLFAPARAGFPVVDGGLFYAMTRDLLENNFRLPLVASYNYLRIPFAYPPLPLYLAATIHTAFKVDLLEVVRWLPSVFSLLALPAFFLLAQEMLGASSKAALAALIFALLPRAYDWTVMGGGLTRAPAALFLLLFLWACYRAFARKRWTMSIWAAFFGGLVLLSHPERSLHAAVAGLLFWLWLDRSKSGAQRAALIGIGTLLVSAPWWITVLSRYGIETYLLAARAGGARWLFWVPLFELSFTDESLPLIAILTVLGAFAAWKNHQRLLPVWFIFVFLTDPRSAPHVIAIHATLLATISLTDFIIPAFERFSKPWQETLGTNFGKVLLGYLLMMMVFNAQKNLLQIGNSVLSAADRQAIAWVAEQTPANSRFLIMDWYRVSTLSPLTEWFPALSQRQNLTTIQGREWLNGEEHFTIKTDLYIDLYNCLDQDAACLETWAAQNEETFDYVYLSHQTPGGGVRVSRLSDSLRAAPAYRLVYETAEVLIFERLP